MAIAEQVRLHDGSTIGVEVHGAGPAVLLPVNPVPIEGAGAEELRRWGADPALGRTLIDGLADAFTVVAFDYEGHVLAVPKPDTLTPANVAADVTAVADAAGVDRFAYYGYSWLALAGLHLALRTERVAALAMGGYPPLGGPQAEMLKVTTATHARAVSNATGQPRDRKPAAADADWSTAEVTLSEGQTRQFVTLYEALQGFDERAALQRLRCPRLVFAGSADEIDYDERWGGVHVSMARPLIDGRADLEALGWQVRVLDGLDHMGAMQAGAVLPILRSFLAQPAQPAQPAQRA
ncbi:alpha/beta hydrolase [Dactylosporangium sp. NPDC051485]|uniref:alpha/beta fold hydrolase n=1 Tax=Dactylosporangium sp. NPDC051485 TaxID=3154846 RepID=UPI003427A361